MRRLEVPATLATAATAFVAAPALMPAEYDWVRHTISESAAQGLSGAWVARLGFLLFGLSVLALVPARRASWGHWASVCHWAFGAFMVAVAAFSHTNSFGGPSDATEDTLHSVAATAMGFAFAIGVLARQAHERRVRVFDAVALAASVLIPMSMLVWPQSGGAVQRVMFAVSLAWYGREALTPDRRH